MAEIFQVIQREARGFAVVQRNVCHAGKMLMAGNGNHGHGDARQAAGVHQDQAFHRALL